MCSSTPACVNGVYVHVHNCASVSVPVCMYVNIGMCVLLSQHGCQVMPVSTWINGMSGVGSPRQRGGACLCTLAWVACVPMFVGVRLSRSAWEALCGEASAGRCVRPRVCLSASAWAAVSDRARPGSGAVGVRPAGAGWLSPLAGRAQRHVRSPGRVALGRSQPGAPEPQAEPRRGPPPTPPPARARAARRAREPKPSSGAETAAAPVGCGDRAPGAAEPAPAAPSPAPSRARVALQPPTPGRGPGTSR